ncbi:hypothetical protein Tco_1414386, partial [Tanacetum coccineum]
MDVGSVNVPYLLARYLRLFAAGRKSGAHISGGQFVARLFEHFRLLTVEILQGLIVIAPALPVIDMAELLNAATGAPEAAKDAPVDDEGGQAVLAPVQGCREFTWTCGEIDDRSGEILHMDDFMYGTADGGEWADIPGIRCDFLRELTCDILKTHQAEDWRGQHLYSPAGPTAARPMIPLSLSFVYIFYTFIIHIVMYLTLKQGINTKEMNGERDDFKCMEAEEKSNLKTSL